MGWVPWQQVSDVSRYKPVLTAIAGGLFAAMSVAYIAATSVVGILTRRLHKNALWNYGVMYLGMGILFAALVGLMSTYVMMEVFRIWLVPGVIKAFR